MSAPTSPRGRLRAGHAAGAAAAWLLTLASVPAADWVKLLDGQPFSRKDHAWALDAGRGVIVLHGGNGNGGVLHGDTWEFDGTTWTEITTTPSPGVREDHAMAWDPVRRRVVLFGGDVGVANDAQTWEHDGRGWALVPSLPAPEPREGHRLAFHAGLGEVVLFGGLDATGTILLGDTWKWNGARWAQVLTPGPAPRHEHAMAETPAGVLLHGGDTMLGVGGDSDETWRFDGAAWTLLPIATPPPAREAHDMAWDPVAGNAVLFGGDPAGAGMPPLADTWVFDGAAWTEVVPLQAPTPRAGHGMAFHPSQGILVFGGGVTEGPLDLSAGEGDDLWRFDGATWSEVVGASPPARRGAAGAYDPDSARVVVYGGRTESGHRDDTWYLDDTGWNRVGATATPGGLHQASAAFSWAPATRGVVLQGGRRQDDTVSNQLWRLVGTAWTPVAGTMPPPLYSTGLAWDGAAMTLRLFGGNRVVPNPLPFVSGETWEHDGTAYRQVLPPAAPSARYRHSMASLDASGATGALLFGGTDSLTAASDETWAYDPGAATWRQVLTPAPGAGRYHAGLCAFAGSATVVVFGGSLANGGHAAMTWEFDPVAARWSPATVTVEPHPRSDFVLVEDPTRARLVLFGGSVESGQAGDTWVFLEDRDRDAIADSLDNCPDTPNRDQADSDGDGVGDACDVCRTVADPGQADSDGDCLPPPYGRDPACGDACATCDHVRFREARGVRVRLAPPSQADVVVAFRDVSVPGPATHHNVYRGSLAAFRSRTYDHAQLPGGAGCRILVSPAIDAAAGSDGVSYYYLVAPACDGPPAGEGSYGRRTDTGAERPRADEPPINGARCP